MTADSNIPAHLRDLPRAYVRNGRVAHLLGHGASLNNSAEWALCGVQPGLGAYWYGSGCQDEIDRLDQLAICLSCERMRRRPDVNASGRPAARR